MQKITFYFCFFLGKQLYSKQYDKNCRNCTSDGNCSRNEQIPRWNFNDFYHSFLLVWRVMCGEWIELLYECLNVTCGDAFCAPLFLTIMFVANFMASFVERFLLCTLASIPRGRGVVPPLIT